MQRIADAHVHAIRPFEKDTIKMLDELAESGVTDASIMALPYRSTVENMRALYTKLKYDKIKVRAFGGLHTFDRYFSEYSPQEQLSALLKMGIDGFKIYHSPKMQAKSGLAFNCEYFDKAFSFAEEHNLPVLVHVGDPDECWDTGGEYDSEEYILKKDVYLQAFDVLDKHPDMRIVFAHFMFLSNDIKLASQILDKYPNVCFDLTPGTEMYYAFDKNFDAWREFFIKYQNRIMFGTDSNNYKHNAELVNLVRRKLFEGKEYYAQYCYRRYFVVKSFNLPSEVVDKICYKNYLNFVGEKVRKVDEQMLLSCAERVLNDITNDKGAFDKTDKWQTFPEDADKIKITVDFCKKILGE